jgi:hypothetical protein
MMFGHSARWDGFDRCLRYITDPPPYQELTASSRDLLPPIESRIDSLVNRRDNTGPGPWAIRYAPLAGPGEPEILCAVSAPNTGSVASVSSPICFSTEA